MIKTTLGRAALACVLVSSLGACSGGSSTLATADNADGVRQSRCSDRSWVAGITELCNGRLVYRDYIYDDYGADANRRTTPVAAGTLARSAGDQTYPAGAENTADLVRLSLWLEGDEVVVEFELNTLYEPKQTRAVLAIDSNALSEPLPDRPTVPLMQPNWEVVKVFDTGDPTTNLIRGRFPKPPGSEWTVWAYTQQAANGTVMNVAFRGVDEQPGSYTSVDGLMLDKGNFWEDRQAVALRNGNIKDFKATVAVADLERGATRFAAIPPGLRQGVYTSAYTLNDGSGPLKQGEGVSANGVPGRHGNTGATCEQYFHYLGKYQPYGLYLPNKPGPHGVQLALHGCLTNHSSLINQPNMQKHLGEDVNRIIVVPLGRGPVGFYSDISERDVLDVLDDVVSQYPVDENRIIAGGYSMGGYGALRFASLYPDRFAALVNWVGFTGDNTNNPATQQPLPQRIVGGGIGNVIDFVANLRHVPSIHLYGAADELIPVTSGLALRQRLLSNTEAVHDFYLHPNADHLMFAVLDSWTREAEYTRERSRVQQPARVTYRTDPALEYPEYGLRHDRAYWISGISARASNAIWDQPADFVDVDLTSQGCGQPKPVFEAGQDNGTTAPLAWNRQFRRVKEATPQEARNRLEGNLRNVAALTIDVAGACLSPAPISYKIETDGPTLVTFSDGRSLALGAAGTHEGTH